MAEKEFNRLFSELDDETLESISKGMDAIDDGKTGKGEFGLSPEQLLIIIKKRMFTTAVNKEELLFLHKAGGDASLLGESIGSLYYRHLFNSITFDALKKCWQSSEPLTRVSWLSTQLQELDSRAHKIDISRDINLKYSDIYNQTTIDVLATIVQNEALNDHAPSLEEAEGIINLLLDNIATKHTYSLLVQAAIQEVNLSAFTHFLGKAFCSASNQLFFTVQDLDKLIISNDSDYYASRMFEAVKNYGKEIVIIVDGEISEYEPQKDDSEIKNAHGFIFRLMMLHNEGKLNKTTCDEAYSILEESNKSKAANDSQAANSVRHKVTILQSLMTDCMETGIAVETQDHQDQSKFPKIATF